MKKFSMNKSKRTVAIIVLTVFLGTIVLSGLAAIIISFSSNSSIKGVSGKAPNSPIVSSVPGSGQSALSEQTPAPTQMQTIEPAASGLLPNNEISEEITETANPSAPTDANNAQNSANTPTVTDLKIYSTNINPEIQTEISGKTLRLTAKVHAPDGIVFAADAYTSKDLMNTRESIKSKSSGGIVKFDIPVNAESGEAILGVLKMDMSDNAGNSEAVSLYGKSGEKLSASGKNASISDYKNEDGTTTSVYYYKFTAVMK